MPASHVSDGVPVRVALVALPLTAWGLEQLLQTQPQRMEVAGHSVNVADALQQLHVARPDVVVVDLEGEAGPESVQDLHAQTTAKILVLTGSSDVALHDRAVLAGARGIFTKSQSPAALLHAIECVHAGEMWLDRGATSRLFMELARLSKTASTQPDHDAVQTLTQRERRIIAEIAADSSAPGKVIAQRLNISENTLRNHLTSIYGKLALRNRVDLYAYALKHGLQMA